MVRGEEGGGNGKLRGKEEGRVNSEGRGTYSRVVRWGKGLVGCALLAIQGAPRWRGLVVVRARCRPRPASFTFVVVRARYRSRSLSSASVIVCARWRPRPLSFTFVAVRIRCRRSFVFPWSGDMGGASRQPQMGGLWGWCRVSGVG